MLLLLHVLCFALTAVSNNLGDAVGCVAQGIFTALCIEGVPSLGRERLGRLYSVAVGYVHLSGTAVSKCSTEASCRMYVDVGYLDNPVL